MPLPGAGTSTHVKALDTSSSDPRRTPIRDEITGSALSVLGSVAVPHRTGLAGTPGLAGRGRLMARAAAHLPYQFLGDALGPRAQILISRCRRPAVLLWFGEPVEPQVHLSDGWSSIAQPAILALEQESEHESEWPGSCCGSSSASSLSLSAADAGCRRLQEPRADSITQTRDAPCTKVGCAAADICAGLCGGIKAVTSVATARN